jgi:SOUL heme-binding protein
MRKKCMWWVIAATAVILLGVALWGPILSNVEQPQYRVVERVRNIEIRNYAPMIVAETDVSGERHKAISEGFRTIADYIFGNNSSAQKVAMTAPVTQQRIEKIAMSAPVTQQGERNAWHVRFVMPSTFTMRSLPQPKNTAVKLKEIGPKSFAVIRFPGVAGENSLKRYTQELNEFISEKDLTAQSAPTYAFYNPPWTLPFLRRNEVMVEIASPAPLAHGT